MRSQVGDQGLVGTCFVQRVETPLLLLHEVKSGERLFSVNVQLAADFLNLARPLLNRKKRVRSALVDVPKVLPVFTLELPELPIYHSLNLLVDIHVIF